MPGTRPAAPDASSQPDLSVVIVSWNTREILRDCLDSVRRAPGAASREVIVVDNASSDGSADMVADGFPEVRLVRHDSNAGFAAANNIGFRLAHGRHVLLLNSDTLVLGDVLRQSVRWMDAHPEVAAMGCRVLNPDRSMQPTCFGWPGLLDLALQASGLSRLPWPAVLGRYELRGWQRDDERDVDVVTGCYLLVRTEALRRVGGLDESFFFCGEETDWCRRFRAAGWAVRFAPVGEIVHIGNASGQRLDSRRDVLLTAGLVRLHRKHGGTVAGLAALAILWTFNASRAAGWGLVATFGSPRAASRRDHFARVLAGFDEVRRRAFAPAAPVLLPAPAAGAVAATAPVVGVRLAGEATR